MKKLLIASLVVVALPLSAQQALDRAKIPPPGKPPVLRVPVWTTTTLANGAELRGAEKHDLPLVSFSITFLGGADQFEQGDRRGAGALTAAMLSAGTKTRDGEALSNALQLLGTSVQTATAGEPGDRQGTRREGAGGLDGRRRQAGVRLSRPAWREAHDDLSRRQAGRGAIDVLDRQPRPAAQHAGLLCAAGDERHPWRTVPVAV